MNTDQGIWKTMIIKPIFIKLNSFVNQKCRNLLFCVIAVLPPNIFMFHLYSKNAEYVDYWYVFIASTVFSIGGLLLYWVISCIGKSPQGSSLVCVFLWVMFFNIYPLYLKFRFFHFFEINIIFKILFIFALAMLLLFFIIVFFKIGLRIKHRNVFIILTVFEVVVFLINFIQASVIYASDKMFIDSESNYKTSFVVESSSPSPNIYWLFMDGMLGFRAMEYFFSDPQIEFEAKLSERGFIVNREAEFDAAYRTAYAVPALMSPFFYDNVMLPVISINTSPLSSRSRILTSIKTIDFYYARVNNELTTAFNAKGYQGNIIEYTIGYFFPIKNIFYFQNAKMPQDVNNFSISRQLAKLDAFGSLMCTSTPFFLIEGIIKFNFERLYRKYLPLESIKEFAIDRNKIYGNLYSGNGYSGNDMWHISALSEIFDGPQPRITIIHDFKNHVPFVLNEEGNIINRKGNEDLDIHNYPPQHHFTRNYLIAFIDLIITNDPDAIIVVQADHGLHHDSSREQILFSGGTEDEVRLIYNQTMSAVRIPDKWGGLDSPLDPLNITRVLVNRYVGQNYELLEEHP